MDKKTFFIEIVLNNESANSFKGTQFLRGVVYAKDVDEAKQRALEYYKPLHTGGEDSVFKVQCAWESYVPTKKIISKMWEEVKNNVSGVARMGEGDRGA